MELRQLESFVAVVEQKSFSRAADKLFISQPTISTHVRMLEDELQTKLIVRTTKSIEVTPHGHELYVCARKMLLLKQDLLSHWGASGKNLISIGASTIPTEYLLPELLPVYRELHPEIEFHIHENRTEEILKGLLSDQFSIAFLPYSDALKALTFLPVYKDRTILITPNTPAYRSFPDDTVSIRTLLTQSPVILRELRSRDKSILALLDALELSEESLHVTARLNDQESVIRLVASGLGISVISEKAASPAIQRGEILGVSLGEYSRTKTYGLALQTQYYQSAWLTDFISFAQRFYRTGENQPDA